MRAAGAAAAAVRVGGGFAVLVHPLDVNEWPQPHEAWAFGLSILNPDSSRPVRKSIVAPLRYGAL